MPASAPEYAAMKIASLLTTYIGPALLALRNFGDECDRREALARLGVHVRAPHRDDGRRVDAARRHRVTDARGPRLVRDDVRDDAGQDTDHEVGRLTDLRGGRGLGILTAEQANEKQRK